MASLCAELVSRRDFITGYSALHWAAKNGQTDVVKLLMGCSEAPDVDARSHGGYTALHVAAMNARHEVIELLVVVYKADPDATDFAGRKPVYYLEHNSGRRASALLRRSNKLRLSILILAYLNSSAFYCRVMLCLSAAFAVARCPSVCHIRVFCRHE